MESKDDPLMDLFGLNSMFTDTSYKEITYEFKEIGLTQNVFALQTAATDFDLTGQVVWQAADIFSRFLFS
jgi:hypothetical protein